MAQWLIPWNPSYFDTDAAFAALPELDWSEAGPRMDVGDLVLLYGTAPIKALTHVCEITRIGMPAREVIPDDEFLVGARPHAERHPRGFMRLRLRHALDEAERAELGIDTLRHLGQTVVRFRTRLAPDAARYAADLLDLRRG